GAGGGGGGAAPPPRLVVGIGASAGGLQPLFELFGAATVDAGVAYVVVTHHGAASELPVLLARHTHLPVVAAVDGDVVHPDRVYVATTPGHLVLEGGVLHVMPTEGFGHRQLPIDRFLVSLARDQGRRAAGVVLSGGGTDGTLGLRAIKAELGLTLAQAPATCEHLSMPRSAIDSGCVDRVDAPAQLAAAVAAHAAVLGDVELPDREADDGVAEHLGRILAMLRAQVGHDFGGYKASTVVRRVQRRMALHQHARVDPYVELLRDDPEEVRRLFHDLLIGVTSFFRDPGAFEALKREALIPMLRDRARGAAVRCWIPACATGEEAYTIAMVMAEALQEVERAVEIQMFATDIDARAIAIARAGHYPDGIAADVSRERLERFFAIDDGGYRVRSELRDMLVFSEHDVIADPPFSKLDLLSCRNFLIYLEAATQRRVLPLFHYALRPGGVLLLGSAESIGAFGEQFEPLDRSHNLYRRLDTPVKRWQQPFVPAGDAVVRAFVQPTRVGTVDVAERVLLDAVVPPSVIVDGRGEVQHVHGRVEPFLQVAPGEPSLNIFHMARPELRNGLAVALRQAAGHDELVQRDGLHVDGDGGPIGVALQVRRAVRPSDGAEIFVIVFERRAPPSSPASAPAPEPEPEALQGLSAELHATRDTLQSTIEQYETTLEELRASNEELQSTNEELRSINEELETSKEEQQSMNEELQTLNAELKDKIVELSRAHDDMRNLLNSTEVATLFLDGELRIQRFTRETTRVANLIQADIGRPIGDLSNKLEYEQLEDDAREVLRTLVFKQVVVRSQDGAWLQVRIMPYRTSDDRISGVVITFFDVTRFHELELALDDERAAWVAAVEASPDADALVDPHGRAVAASAGFWTAVGASAGEAARATNHDVAIAPLPLTSIAPRASSWKRPSSSAAVAALIWIRPGSPCDSIRAAVFTVSPQRS
ncbi:MAG: PAS domain-containing protein, partial [Myxococcales bacterium]|nr:PAS domain-containing protein [Myxococcales bacterium]